MRKWLLPAAIVVVFLIAAGLVIHFRLPGHLHKRVEHLLSERFHTKVTVGRLGLSFLPLPGITVDDVKVENPDRSDVPPLIQIKRFVARTDVITLFGAQRDVTLVRIEGLRITVPTGTPHRKQAQDNSGQLGSADNSDSFPFVIKKIIADGAVLVTLPKDPGKDPLEWDIQKLTLTSVGRERPMNFVATLMNPKPPGEIHSTGTFGPWQSDDPGGTPLGGHYIFQNADMGVFKGLSGTLSSTGGYKGSLSAIDVNGTTDIPNFKVGDGNVVDLKTKFSATVDGTSGNTLLHPVIGTYRNSEFICNGGVVGTPGVKGKKITLDVKTNKARIEDILLLVMNIKRAALEGPASFKAKLVLPQGDVPVINKLFLDGNFAMTQAQFTSDKFQDKLDLYSNRSMGLTNKGDRQNDVASNLKTKFVLKNGTARLSSMEFSIPGIQVFLRGRFGLTSDNLDFRGRVRLHGSVSQMTTGWKSWLLKPIDPFFKKNGAGAVIPIKITGTRKDPHYGVDFHDKENPIPKNWQARNK